MPTTLQQLKEQGEKEFDEKFPVGVIGHQHNERCEWECCLRKDIKAWDNSQMDLAYKTGELNSLKELAHKQQTLLDGFSHPEDCEMCKELRKE